MASPGSVVINLAMKADQARRDALDFAKSLVQVDTAAATVDGSLSQAQRAITRTGDLAAQSAPDLQRAETALDGLADEGDLAAQRLRTSAGQMAEGIRQGGAGIATETTNIKTQMGEVGRETGAEFVGNIAEGIGSGTASINDVVSGTLGGITNLAASLTGPLGIAAAGAAAGIGLVFQAVQGQAADAKQKVDDLRAALAGVADLAGQEAQAVIFQTWLEDAQKTTGKIEKVDQTLHDAGVTAEEFQAALAGDPTAIETVRTKLQKAGGDIVENQKKTGKLTEEQKRYMDTFPTILQDIKKSDESIGAVRREHKAINDLLGKTPGLQGKVTEETSKTKSSAKGVKDEIDAIPSNKTVTITVKYVDKNGNPVDPSHVGLSAASVAQVGVAQVGARAVGARAPTVVNVNATGTGVPDSPRAVVAMLETHQARMGRRPGAPRARAW